MSSYLSTICVEKPIEDIVVINNMPVAGTRRAPLELMQMFL